MASKQEVFECKVKTIKALEALQSAWYQCEKAFTESESVIELNNFIVEYYPFQNSFSDIDVQEWGDNSIEKLEESLYDQESCDCKTNLTD